MKKRTALASQIDYLLPEDCGSTIGYTIIRNYRGVTATVDLADCNRKIEWYFGVKTPVEKIDKAIETLTQFRRDLIKARNKKT